MSNKKTRWAVGIDVSKHSLEVCILALTSEKVVFTGQFTNDLLGIGELFKVLEKRLGQAQSARMHLGFESTGGYERELFLQAYGGGYTTSRIHPHHARDFRKSMGWKAKTDAIDAHALALYVRRQKPQVTEPVSAGTQELRELLQRRKQLQKMFQQEQRRKELASETLQESLDTMSEHIKTELDYIEECLDELMTEEESLAKAEKVLCEVDGIGEKTARALLGYLPMLGTVSGAQIAALSGVAPYAVDSGKYQGTRRIRGGCKELREFLYMAAAASMREGKRFHSFAQRLKKKGKPSMVVRVAVMRKLVVVANAMMRDFLRKEL